MTQLYADIIIDISHEKVDRTFQYKIPPELTELIQPGMRVHVPFGSGNKERTGYVIDVTEKAEFPVDRMKSILAVDEKGINLEGKCIRIAYWMKRQYGSTTINALKTVLPVKQKLTPVKKKKVIRNMPLSQLQEIMEECDRKHYVAKSRVLRVLLEEEMIPYDLLKDKLKVSPATLQSLEKQGCLSIEEEQLYRNPVKGLKMDTSAIVLREEQQVIVDEIMRDYCNQNTQTYLIHGVTGSGKTEVYLGIIEKMIAMGKQAIVLIPEIALTYQTLMRFYKRFGDRVSVMNSTLSAGEKYDQMERAKKGDIDVIIGPRSALFTPFPNLGVIIIDEEHEQSYKSENMPKYHARETAIEIAHMHGASVVLGSATPSLEAYYRAKCGEYKLYTMENRHGGSILPDVYTVDLREELKQGNRSVFSHKLQELIEDRLQKKEQVMLFLNRRGLAGFVSCRSCGTVMKCPHCDVSLSEHRGNVLLCHYCGYTQKHPKLCPSCGSKYLMGFKAGTEQIEEALYKRFPDVKVLRMDADTTRTKDSYDKILAAFAEQQADILVGTQMIVKGHDFPNVTLVGVLAADLSLNQNDYRAGERTFQLLTQAAGRAGRGDKRGEVVIQTYQPDHYSIVHAAKQDYVGFYEEEIAYRDFMQYPPVAHMLVGLVVSKSKVAGEEMCLQLTEYAKNRKTETGIVNHSEKDNYESVVVIGPTEATIGRINDLFRQVFYIRSEHYDVLVQMKDELEELIRNAESKDLTVQFDFDPMTTY